MGVLLESTLGDSVNALAGEISQRGFAPRHCVQERDRRTLNGWAGAEGEVGVGGPEGEAGDTGPAAAYVLKGSKKNVSQPRHLSLTNAPVWMGTTREIEAG